MKSLGMHSLQPSIIMPHLSNAYRECTLVQFDEQVVIHKHVPKSAFKSTTMLDYAAMLVKTVNIFSNMRITLHELAEEYIHIVKHQQYIKLDDEDLNEIVVKMLMTVYGRIHSIKNLD